MPYCRAQAITAVPFGAVSEVPTGEVTEPMSKLTGSAAQLRDGLRATLPAWLFAHAFLLALCWVIDPHGVFSPLFAWDTHWYWVEANGMAQGGPVFTDSFGSGGLAHFFPLTSMFVAGLVIVTRLPVTFVLFGFCWAFAWLFGALVHMIAVRETGDRVTASRAAWLSQLAPGAFALQMGYTEPLADVLAALYFLAIRRRHAGWAFLIGLLAGVSRPTGIVLALAGFVEALRAAHRAGWTPRSIAAGLAQSASPVLGLLLYLGYCQVHFRDWVLPYSQQVASDNRGAVTQNPIATVQDLLSSHAEDILISSAACALIAVVALFKSARLLPASFTAWSAVMLVLSVTSPQFSSEPRYLAAIIPLLIALPALLRNRWAWCGFMLVDLALLWWVSWLALSWKQVA